MVKAVIWLTNDKLSWKKVDKGKDNVTQILKTLSKINGMTNGTAIILDSASQHGAPRHTRLP